MFQYITEVLENPVSAHKTISKIIKRCGELSVFPKGSVVKYVINKAELRSVKVNNFIVFYEVDDEQSKVIVRDVIYARRDVKNLV
ncbi:type II toxin-antitoxin system RelE/ParE family toxin [Candidatus Saccharibacteria bacterium]|nr:type II toxin-antitoxin system RelE/ParE family toxin [Candidatus Saccharibacteria bacterium]